VTTGSWTVEAADRSYFAHKAWSGSNGKTEPYFGGIRDKWNSYTLLHQKRRQIPQEDLREHSAGPPSITMAEWRGTCGWSNNDFNNMLNKLAAKVRGHSFDLGVNLAEAGKTYGTLVRNVQSVGSALLHLKHGRISAALRELGSGRRQPVRGGIRPLNARDLSGRWLETQYAFMPLISQSYEAAKALEVLTGPRVLRFRVSSAVKRKTLVYPSTGPYVNLAHWTYSQVLLCELYEDLSLARSLGLLDPLTVAWELVPYSFVVDWFLPIGSYLSAWSVIPKLNGRFLWTERAGWKQGPFISGDPVWLASIAKSKVKQEAFRMSRVPTSAIDVPRPSFRSVPEALSPRRILSAVSLIHQRLR
jgi:hypothetical protein